MMRNSLLIIIAFILPLPVAAQSHMIGFGPSRILDTYISQEKYAGVGLTYLYIREGKKPEKHWQNTIEHEIDLSKTKDRTNTTSMLEGNYNLYWGRYRQWRLCDDRLRLQAGGCVRGGHLRQAQDPPHGHPEAVRKLDLWREDLSRQAGSLGQFRHNEGTVHAGGRAAEPGPCREIHVPVPSKAPVLYAAAA